MTTTETRPEVEAPPCRRCHGTGHEPMPKPPVHDELDSPAHRKLIARLVELGQARAIANRHTAVGRKALDKAYAGIRKLAPEGERLGVTRVEMMQAVGVSKAAYYKILSGETGNP